MNSTFINNTADGGAIYNEGNCSVIYSTFINNTDDKERVNITCNKTLNVEIIDRNVSGNITFQINNKTYSNELKNNRTTINLDNVESGKEYDLILTFVTDNNDNIINNTYIIYDKLCGDTSVQPNDTLKGIIISAPDVVKYYNGTEKLKVTLKDKDNKTMANEEINIAVNYQTYTKTTDSNGEVLMDINFDAGVYNAIITYTCSSSVTPSMIVKIIVKPLTTELKLSYVKNNRKSVTLTADVNPSTATGNLVFNVNGRKYNAVINNSKASYVLSNLDIGSYNIYSLYNGDANHENSTSNSISFTIDENGIDISAPSITKYYKGTERFKVQITDEKGNALNNTAVTITINGVSYDRKTNEFGNTPLGLGLDSGVYDVIINCSDYSVGSTVTIKPTVVANDFTKIFKNGTQYLATFTDSLGNLLKEGNAIFNINGVNYTRKINDSGISKLNINLLPGEYIITATNPVTEENHGSIITVLSCIDENYNITKYYKNATQYSVRVLDANGNPVGKGAVVQFNINGVLYNRTTNASGHAKLNINLPAEKYIISATYNGLTVSNIITVLSTLIANDMNMKYRDGSKFEVKLVDKQGNKIANQNVTFNINGVFYNRTTNDEGFARLNINLPEGEYIISSTYEDAVTSNTIKIYP